MKDDYTNPFDNQELAAFIEATLKAISTGIKHASSEIRANADSEALHYDKFAPPRDIAFDVAVSVREETTKKGAFKIGVASIGGDVGKSNAALSETVSRVSFSVPMLFEYTDKGREQAKRNADENGRNLATMMNAMNHG